MVQYWPPTNSFLLLESVPILGKIYQEMRSWECPQTNTQIHWQTSTHRFYNLSHAICYSHGADNYHDYMIIINFHIHHNCHVHVTNDNLTRNTHLRRQTYISWCGCTEWSKQCTCWSMYSVRWMLLLHLVSQQLISYNSFLLSDKHHLIQRFHNQTVHRCVDCLLVAVRCMLSWQNTHSQLLYYQHVLHCVWIRSWPPYIVNNCIKLTLPLIM